MNGENGTSPFTRTDLSAVIRQPACQPRTLADLIYKGRLHSVAGPPEAGKTVFTLWLAMTAIGFGRDVLIVDEEAGPEQTADLLRSMGADPAMIEKHLHYVPFPGADWRQPSTITYLHEFLARHRPVLSVWDSSAAMMAHSGCNENDPGDVTRFWKRVWLPVGQQFHCSVLVTDHDAKGTGDARSGRGSGAKLAEVDVQFKLTPLKNFTHHQDGKLSLSVTKDRPGWLHRHWEIRVTRDPLALALRRTAAPFGGTAGGDMSPAKAGILAALTMTPLNVKQLTDRFAHAEGHGLRRQTVSTILNELLTEGLADRVDQGPGVEALWMLPPPPPDPADTDGQGGWEPGTVGDAAQNQGP